MRFLNFFEFELNIPKVQEYLLYFHAVFSFFWSERCGTLFHFIKLDTDEFLVKSGELPSVNATEITRVIDDLALAGCLNGCAVPSRFYSNLFVVFKNFFIIFLRSILDI